MDKESQKLWDKYTTAKFSMLMASNTDHAPWTIVKSDDKKKARVNCIKYILSKVDYENKIEDENFMVDEKIVSSGREEIKTMEEENKFARI